MLDLGTVKPGSTIRIPISTYAGSTGASATATGFAASDVEIYKDGGTTQRASDAGYTATTDFDALTGLHLLIIDLADNTTADFFVAGSEYLVAVADITVDSQTVRAWVARFRIGYPGAILDTTIATLSSQTSFTLTAGPAEANALIGCPVIVHDIASAVQIAFGYISAYAVTTKTVTLAADPGIFTMAAGDNISVFPRVQVFGIAGTAQTARDIGASVLLSSGTGAGQISLSSGAVLLQATQTGVTIPTVTAVTNAVSVTGDLSATMKASVNAEVDTALSDYGALKPTTAGRTLDVTATGAAGIDWANVENPTTVVGLSGTTVKTATDVEADTVDIQSRIPAALVSGRIDSSVGAMAANTMTASALAADAVAEIAVAILDAFATASDSVQASPSPTTTAFAGSAALSASDDFYNGSVLVFTAGSLDGIARKITDYTGSTRLITLSPALPVAPSSSDTFRILGRID